MKIGNKKNYNVLIILLLICISIGYAVLSTTLNINGKSTISKNTWDVHFDNVQVTDGSVEAVKIPTIEGNTTVDFEVGLNLPGDYYEFTVDVVNNGTIDAMIESIEKTPELTTAQQKYLNYIIEYQNEEQIQSNQIVNSGKFLRLKVKIEFKKDIDVSDLSEIDLSLDLSFSLNFVQADDNGINVISNGIKAYEVVSGVGTELGDEICIANECFYVMNSNDDKITMLSKYNLYVGGYHDGTFHREFGSEATGKQDENMLGRFPGQTFIYKGTIKFSSTYYWGTGRNGQYVYDSNSILYPYVENYKTYLMNQGANIIEARLIKYDEVIELGCNKSNCNSAPEWVYSTSYWTGNVSDIYDSISGVFKDRYLTNNLYNSVDYFGIRPVIVINKNDLKKKIIEFSIGNTTYQAEEGMTWKEFVNSDYNDGTVSLSGVFVISDGSLLKNEEGQDQIDSSIIQNDAVYIRTGELPPI